MRNLMQTAAVAAMCLVATGVQAKEQGFGQCKEGFADGTQVKTEARGERMIAEVQVNDRIWSFNQSVGRPGWSKILRRVDDGKYYKLLVDFTEPGADTITKACWRIKRSS